MNLFQFCCILFAMFCLGLGLGLITGLIIGLIIAQQRIRRNKKQKDIKEKLLNAEICETIENYRKRKALSEAYIDHVNRNGNQ